MSIFLGYKEGMTKPRYLTKSRFKLAVQCPTKLFYTGKKNIYRDTMQEDSFLAIVAMGGDLIDQDTGPN